MKTWRLTIHDHCNQHVFVSSVIQGLCADHMAVSLCASMLIAQSFRSNTTSHQCILVQIIFCHFPFSSPIFSTLIQGEFFQNFSLNQVCVCVCFWNIHQWLKSNHKYENLIIFYYPTYSFYTCVVCSIVLALVKF